MKSTPAPEITEAGVKHAYTALSHVNDLIREVLIVKDELGYYDWSLNVKRRLARDLEDLEAIKERLNRITLRDVQR
jgi:hypothetical protein